MHATADAPASNSNSTDLLASVEGLIASGDLHAAAQLVISAAPPSQHWLPAAAVGPLTSQQQLAGVRAEAEPTWPARCAHLRNWALKELRRSASADQGLVTFHAALLQYAAAHGTGHLGGTGWFKWRWSGNGSTTSSQQQQLANAAFHLSCSDEEAWLGLAQALSHGLTLQPEDPYLSSARTSGSSSHSHKGSGSGKHSGGSRHGSRSARSVTLEEDRAPLRWVPNSSVKRIETLQSKQAEIVKHLLAAQRKQGATLEADLLETARAALPTTYLQLVGQRLLAHCHVNAPTLLALPAQAPRQLVAALYGRPFAAAVALALEAIKADPLGDPAPFVPSPQCAGRCGRSRGFRRIYPSPTAAAGEVAGGGAVAAPARGRANLGVLACVCRDVQDFQLGLELLLEGIEFENGGSGNRSGSSTGAAARTLVAQASAAAVAFRPVMVGVVAEAVERVVQQHRGDLGAVVGEALGEACQVIGDWF